jgi:hypothetical protein
MSTKRIRISKEELLAKYLEVQNAPESLKSEMTEAPLIYLISKSSLKPMNFEENPFAIAPSHHFGGGKPHYNKQFNNEGGNNQGRPKKQYGGDES